jgi:pimeloyl-ACP methyl ester carboxylesterase
MVIPGFLASDRSTLGLQRALAGAGFRVTGWGLGLNAKAGPETLDAIVSRLEEFAGGRKAVLVGWSLGGIFARETAKMRPDLVAKVVTLGTPFSGDPHANNAWRVYELVTRRPVDKPPIESDLAEKPPVPTIAIWSCRDGVIAPAAARGREGERDAEIEMTCSHMGYAVSSRAWPRIVEAVRAA